MLSLDDLRDPATRGKFKEWRDELAGNPRTADYAWTTLARVLSFAKDRGKLGVNVCERGGRLYTADHTEKNWTEEHLTAVRAGASPEILLALEMALWTGQRQGDLLRVTWAAFDGDALRLRQGKTGARVVVPVAAVLKKLLNVTSRRAKTILTTTRGHPWTEEGFRSAWAKLCNRAGISGLTFHDLRGTTVTRLALAGCTTIEIAAVTGHSPKDVDAILRAHYLGGQAELAKQAIGKLRFRSTRGAAKKPTVMGYLSTISPRLPGKTKLKRSRTKRKLYTLPPRLEIPMITCPRCQAQSDEGKRFCADCGGPIDPALPQIKQYLAVAMRDELKSLLREEYQDQKYLELSTSQAIVERITSWAKVFSALVAVPIGIVFFVLGAIGIKTFSDFTSEIREAQSSVETSIQQAKETASRLSLDGSSLTIEYEKLKSELGEYKQISSEIASLTTQFDDISQKVNQTQDLSAEVKRIDSKVNSIEDSLRSMLAIGNSDYDSAPDLVAPKQDIDGVTSAFTEIGFRVTSVTDASKAEMEDEIAEFISSISPGDTVVFFYSGHGVEINKESFLIPTDALLENAESLILQSTNLQNILAMMTDKNPRVVVLIVDACRDNPFDVTTRGLSIVTAPPGVFVLYSSSPGELALDVVPGEKNSAFAKALIDEIKVKGRSLDDIAKAVRTSVEVATENAGYKQTVSFQSRAQGEIYLAGRE